MWAMCGKWCVESGVEGVGDGVGDGWRNAREKDLERTGDRFLKTVGSLPNTTLTGATVDRFETVRNGRFLRKPFLASASQTRPKHYYGQLRRQASPDRAQMYRG